MDFTLELARAWIALAEQVGGNAELTNEAKLVIHLPNEEAVSIAAGISNDDFPFSYVVAEDDGTLVMGF